MVSRIKSIMWYIGIALFLVVIIIGGVERAMIQSNGTENFRELQDEYVSPDEIQSVTYDDEAKLLYIGYKWAPCVNVYSYDGDFRWCVMTEYIGPCYYEVIDNSLIIYGTNTAYIYDSKNGNFSDKVESDDLELSYEYMGDYVSIEDMKEGDIYYDKHQVYVMSSVGKLNKIIERPDWYVLFDYSWVVGISGILLIIIVSTISIIEKRRNRE